MVEAQNHQLFVTVWMGRGAKDLPAERLLQLFEEGFGALWARAQQILGEVTLTAIADRAFHVAGERYPYLRGLQVVAGAPHCQELKERAATLRDGQLVDAIGFVLAEFLTVLGNLTGEVLTPALHAALWEVTRVQRGPDRSDALNGGVAHSPDAYLGGSKS